MVLAGVVIMISTLPASWGQIRYPSPPQLRISTWCAPDIFCIIHGRCGSTWNHQKRSSLHVSKTFLVEVPFSPH